ncbi:MAG: DNA repair protein RecO [Bacteroidota bacterium]
MLIKTRGIVLRAVKYSETSLILDIYTEAKGLRSYIVSGVRSRKSKVSAGLVQLMSLVDMVAYHRDEKDLNRIREIKAAHIYEQLPFDIRRSSVGMFMTELIRKSIREIEENPALFHYLFESFRYLDSSPHRVANLHIQFMVELTAFLGFAPAGHYQDDTAVFDMLEGRFLPDATSHLHFMDETSSQLLGQFIQSDQAHCHDIPLDRATRRKFLLDLLDYYRLHIENFSGLNTLDVLEDVFG